jgi:protein O-GlcNAc transferase
MLSRLFRQLAERLNPPARFMDAYRLYSQGDIAGAERTCARLIRSGRDVGDAHYLRAQLERRRGREREAMVALRLAVQSKPDEGTFRLDLARTLMTEGQTEQALAELQHAVRSTAGTPLECDALVELALACMKTSRTQDAIGFLARVLALEPDHALALQAHAAASVQQGDIEAARASAAHCARVAPSAAARIRRALMLPAIPRDTAEIAEARARLSCDLDELLADPPGEIARPELDVGMTLFNLAYHGENDRDLMVKLARVYRAAWPAALRVAVPVRKRGSRLRLGFVSTYLRFHSIGRLNHGLIRDMPRDRFETVVFSIGEGEDALAAEIAKSADEYVRLPASMAAVTRAIADAGLDALLFTDIGMHPFTYFLAFHRLAPLQLVTWGHPVTTGIDTVDLFLSAQALEVAEANAHYSEELLRLPAFFLPGYRRPQLSGPTRSREELGLPRNGPLFLCPQTLFKLHPDVDALFGELLDRVPDGQLLLLDSHGGLRDRATARLATRLGSAMKRVHFLPNVGHAEFLERIAASDVALDTLHFGGGNTTYEALAMGTPVVTLPATYLRGRFTLGCYRELGIDEFVARDVRDYVDIAARLALEPDARRRTDLAARAASLFERRDAADALALELEARL